MDLLNKLTLTNLKLNKKRTIVTIIGIILSTALITGFTAKESVVSTMTVLLGGKALNTMFSPQTAIVFLVFTLLYTPCVAAISSVKRELGGKWAMIVVLLQCAIAWLIAFAVKIFI